MLCKERLRNFLVSKRCAEMPCRISRYCRRIRLEQCLAANRSVSSDLISTGNWAGGSPTNAVALDSKPTPRTYKSAWVWYDEAFCIQR